MCVDVVQVTQKLRVLCQEKLLQQLPEAVRPAALAAAGRMVLDPSEPCPQSPAASHDEDANAMSIDNASCTTLAEGTLRAPNVSSRFTATRLSPVLHVFCMCLKEPESSRQMKLLLPDGSKDMMADGACC